MLFDPGGRTRARTGFVTGCISMNSGIIRTSPLP
jgi:hypothetical protein